MPMNDYDWLEKWVHSPIMTNPVTTKPKLEPKFKVGDVVIQNVFEDRPRRGVVKSVRNYSCVVKLDGGKEHYNFLDFELKLVPSHKEFTDEEYESLLV